MGLLATGRAPQLRLDALSPNDRFQGGHLVWPMTIRADMHRRLGTNPMDPKRTPSWIVDGYWDRSALAPMQTKPVRANPTMPATTVFGTSAAARMRLG